MVAVGLKSYMAEGSETKKEFQMPKGGKFVKLGTP
jgi:hypothetical protein